MNRCLNSRCSHICLLSSSATQGYTCVCPRGFELQPNGIDCIDLGTVRPMPVIGSCAAAGYDNCCASILPFSFCAGSEPHNCFCDRECLDRGDCCPDITTTCPMEGSCINAGYQTCCSLTHSVNFCRGDDNNCMCDFTCTFFGDCCSDYPQICPGGFPGTCSTAGYTGCCMTGDCFGAVERNCKCDAACRLRGDCCSDIDSTCPTAPVISPSTTVTAATPTMEIPTMVTTTPTATPIGTPTPPSSQLWLPFINLTETVGVQPIYLGRSDDGSYGPITVSGFFPFGSSLQTEIYINNNGIISFKEPFTNYNPMLFPSMSSAVRNAYLVAPFWSDIDTRLDGQVLYEIHNVADGNDGSLALLDGVNAFISNYTSMGFGGVWMMVVEWNGVHPYPGTTTLSNTFQAILITDYTQSFVVFTYNCELMEWSGLASIGYSDYGNDYYNYLLSGSVYANAVACDSLLPPWNNVVKNVTGGVVPTPIPTVPPPPSNSLPFLEDLGGNWRLLDSCATSWESVNITETAFPFGVNYHNFVYINTGGVISFTSEFSFQPPILFPGRPEPPFFASAVAPFWAQIDSCTQGSVTYKAVQQEESMNSTENRQLERVSMFVNSETNALDFEGSWMLVVTWDGVQEKQKGTPFVAAQTNKFQAIIITNGTKSYAIFTYKCGLINWSGAATIGFNARGSYYDNHPFSGTHDVDYIDCINTPDSIWNNLIYDLVPEFSVDNFTVALPPPYGSCFSAGFYDCCILEDPLSCTAVYPPDCFCDKDCFVLGDCCSEFEDMGCPNPFIGVELPYLVVADNNIRRISTDGNLVRTLYSSTGIAAIDYDYQRQFIYFLDNFSNYIIRMNLDGSNPMYLIDTGNDVVSDLAVDWIANNIYWTDTERQRIVVSDLDSVYMYRKKLIVTGPDSIPSSIAVDPVASFMYWTDAGSTPKIERASMDGTDRHTLHSTDLLQPSSIAIDYRAQKIYWTDTLPNRIESSYFDGSIRTTLTSVHGYGGFSIALERRVLYWANSGIFATNRETGSENITIYDGRFAQNASNILVVSIDHQNGGSNPCDGNNCSHLCLLSRSPEGFSCACPDGALLMSNGLTCVASTTSSAIPSISASSTDIGIPPASSSFTPAFSTVILSTSASSTATPASLSQPPSQPTSIPMRTTTTAPVPTSTVAVKAPFSSNEAVVVTSTVAVKAPFSSNVAVVVTSTGAVKAPFSTNEAVVVPSSTRVSRSSERLILSTSSARIQPTSALIATSQTKMAASSTPTPPEPSPVPTSMGIPTTSPPPAAAVINLEVATPVENQLVITWRGLQIVDTYFLQVSNYSGEVAAALNVPVSSSINGMDFLVTLQDNIGPYIPYNITVYGVDQVGPGIPTSIYYIFTAEAVPPVAPEVDEPSRDDAETIKVSWKELTPDRAYGIVTNYTVSYKKANSGKTRRQTDSKGVLLKVLGSDKNHVILDNLDADLAYVVVVWANTSVGKGKESPEYVVDVLGATSKPQPGNGVDAGSIAGGAVGGILVLAAFILGILVVLYFVRRHNKVKITSYDIFRDENSSPSVNEDDDDRAKILATSITRDPEEHKISVNPMATFDNPTYAATGLSDSTKWSEPDGDMEKEDLAMIGRPISYEDDIEL